MRTTDDIPSAALTFPPVPADLRHLVPRDGLGWGAVGSCALLTAGGIALAATPSWALWAAGQAVLTVALVQWFILLHECGHDILFHDRRLHALVGRAAGFFALIPFESWRRVHARHHRWTGWQDLDPTTAALVPRPLGRVESWVANTAWRWWIPLFSVLYRLTNYWHLPRLWSLFPQRPIRRRLLGDALVLLALYGGLVAVVGPGTLARLVGVALVLSLAFQDPLLLSQHTHMPLHLSQGQLVSPYPTVRQEVFTRSLRFPEWVSRAVLFGFDAHELHHMYPFVPGYHLRKIAYDTHNDMPWWAWLRAAKRVPGTVFLFQNRSQTGLGI